MKDFAMLIWEMPAGEFMLWALVAAGAAMAIRFVATEVHIARMKRMDRIL